MSQTSCPSSPSKVTCVFGVHNLLGGSAGRFSAPRHEVPAPFLPYVAMLDAAACFVCYGSVHLEGVGRVFVEKSRRYYMFYDEALFQQLKKEAGLYEKYPPRQRAL
jgi:hypothetical protein